MIKSKWFKKFSIIFIIVNVVIITIQQMLPIKGIRFFGIGLPSPMVQFISTHYQFSIEYPKTWFAKEYIHPQNPDYILVRISLPPKPLQAIVFQKEFSNSDANNLLDWSKDICSSENDCTLNFSESYNSPYYEGILWHYDNDGTPSLGWYTLIDDVGYGLVFSADSKYWEEAEPVFMEMIDSFQLLDEQ